MCRGHQADLHRSIRRATTQKLFEKWCGNCAVEEVASDQQLDRRRQRENLGALRQPSVERRKSGSKGTAGQVKCVGKVQSGRTLSEFVVASAQKAARRVIQEHENIRLSRAEQVAFVTTLLKPPAPNKRLRQAAAAYRKQMGL